MSCMVTRFMADKIHSFRRFFEGLAQIGQFTARNRELQERNSRLEEMVDSVAERNKVLESEFQSIQEDLCFLLGERAIDAVRIGPFLNFMFEDDVGYKALPEGCKKKTNLLGQYKHTPASQLALTQFIRNWTPKDSATRRLLAHFLKYLPNFSAVDIGCQYGSSAMQTARFIHSLSAANRVHAFDPGLAG